MFSVGTADINNNEYIGYNSNACRPFSVPTLGATIPALFSAALMVVFSVGVSYFGFEINPLSRHPAAMCNGRVEVVWVVFKTMAIVLLYGMYNAVYASVCNDCVDIHTHTHTHISHTFSLAWVVFKTMALVLLYGMYNAVCSCV